MPRVLFVGGGSLGHLSPAIAVMEELRAHERECSYHFVCEDIERDCAFLDRMQCPYTPLRIEQGPARFLYSLPSLLHAAHKMIENLRPDVLFCKGGRISIPLALAARKQGVPIILHESDAVMGRANWFLSRFATNICLSFEEAAKNYELKTKNYIVTGNPVRKALLQGSRGEGLRITGFSGARPILLVMGGSQGAEALNRILLTCLDTVLTHADVIHLYGEGKSYGAARPGYFARSLAHDELPHLYKCATIALSRGGANTITELGANSIPMILVPLMGLAQNHQEANAKIAVASGGALLLQENECPEGLLKELRTLLGNDDRRTKMSIGARRLHRNDAAQKLVEVILRSLSVMRMIGNA